MIRVRGSRFVIVVVDFGRSHDHPRRLRRASVDALDVRREAASAAAVSRGRVIDRRTPGAASTSKVFAPDNPTPQQRANEADCVTHGREDGARGGTKFEKSFSLLNIGGRESRQKASSHAEKGHTVSGRSVCISKRRKAHLLKLAAETTTTARRRHAEKLIVVTPLDVALLMKAGPLEEHKTSGVARSEYARSAPRETRAETPRARTGAVTMDDEADMLRRNSPRVTPLFSKEGRAEQWTGQLNKEVSSLLCCASFIEL